MIFRPRYIKEARHYVHAGRRILRYRCDLLKPAQIESIEARISTLEDAARSRSREKVANAIRALEDTVGRVAPPPPNAGLRENCEVLLVAIVIAAGIRSYFLQPFKIPTGSMQPTLYGIIGKPSDEPPPNFVVRVFDFFVRGRTYLNEIAREDDVVIATQSWSRLNYFTFTDVITEKGKYTIFAPEDTLRTSFGVMPGRVYRKGDAIARGHVDNGDFVFVDKMTYNFTKPERAQVFVFKTTGIKRIEERLEKDTGSQYYIKRLAGLPGDALRIDPPDLYINGSLAAEPAFKRVMSEKDGYRGYASGLDMGMRFPYLRNATDSFTVPPRCYFALGDNSYNSSDSRYWGTVPEANVTGRGLLVFWPFSARWGLIR